MSIHLDQLQNGMKVITESVDSVETVSLGIWLPKGSRDEQPHENGMFHFIEHTLFKGTARWSARAIAEEIEGRGGLLDAYTAKEETCYSVKVRDVHLKKTLGILADMLQNPAFREEELDRERQVILEEIKMEEDNPEDVVYEKCVAHFWGDHAIARPILGSVENVCAFKAEQVRNFHTRFYNTDNLVVSAAGKLDHAALCDHLSDLFPVQNLAIPAAPDRHSPKVTPFQVYMHHDHFEQVNFCLCFDGIAQSNPRRYTLYLLSTLLGGGMSSRLFQNIREERGLAYSVGCFTSPYSDCGQFTVYGGCSPNHFDQVMELSLKELLRLKKETVPLDELNRAREQFTSALVMSLESTSSRSSALAKDLICMDRVFDVSRSIAEVEAVTPEHIQEMALELISDDSLGVCALGRVPHEGPQTAWTVSAPDSTKSLIE